MYNPPHFAETRVPVLHDAIRAFGLATLVGHTAEGLIATHIPMLIDPEPAPYGTLIGHIARANPHGKGAMGRSLAIFLGPEGYMTPSYYATKRETGKVVPTWNYAAIHAHGTLRVIDDRDWLLDHITRLTNHHESGRTVPWAVDDAPADFVETMLKSIVGVEMTIERLEGKWKMSQNRPQAEHAGIEAGLREDGFAALADQVAARTKPGA